MEEPKIELKCEYIPKRDKGYPYTAILSLFKNGLLIDKRVIESDWLDVLKDMVENQKKLMLEKIGEDIKDFTNKD